MAKEIHPRRGFWRKTRNGSTYVSSTFCVVEAKGPKKSDNISYCKKCGAALQVRRANGGGLIPYEKGLAHLGTLHSCFTVGRGMSKYLATDTEDLFDYIKRKQTKMPPKE